MVVYKDYLVVTQLLHLLLIILILHVNGLCSDCISPDCICAQVVVTRVSSPAGRIKVILVGEDLGLSAHHQKKKEEPF